MDIEKLKNIGANARESALKNNYAFENMFYNEFSKILKIPKSIPEIKTSKELLETFKNEDLPKISVITPTYNRQHMAKLMFFNYKITSYPKDKIEWIILDDGEHKLIKSKEEIENLLKYNIKYIELSKKLDIGEKRNLSVSYATNDIIVFMDDDDYYPPESIKLRVIQLIQSNKECLGCSTIGCFHINKFISIINVPPHEMGLEERLSEATLCFYKKFWESQKFKDESKGSEALEFIKNRTDKFLEINWENIIVSLLHKRNTSTKITYTDQPNGCHFGWSDELFLFLTNLDKLD